MPSVLVKATPGRDLYCVWSTVVDNVTWIGTRAAFVAERPGDESSPERLARTDLRGTSVITHEDDPRSDYATAEYGWDDTGFVVTNITNSPEPFYWLPRANLAAYLDAILADDDAAMYATLNVIPLNEEG
jgi:hypothetical protein